MAKKWILAILIFLFLSSNFNFVLAQETSIEINFFSSAICPHCAKEREFLKGLEKKYPEIKVREYEVFYQAENREILKGFYEKYKVPVGEQGLVPATFTPTKYFIGFSEEIGKEIESCIRNCLGQGQESSPKIKIPILGSIALSKMSLPLLTAVLGTLDGFNPCAMWILVILVSLLLTLKSRRKLLLVGGTFIFAEGLLYFLFMSAWLNVFLALGYISLITTLIGIFGVVFGVWRIRDFFTWKPGVCKVVDNSKSQEKIMSRLQNLLKPTTVPATILGVIVLAFGVNLIEFLCSAGFPTLYTKILSLQNVGTFQYYLYLVFYNIFYMLDDFIVFGFAFFFLSRFGFSEKYNRYSTLIAGVLILVLGILLLFNPKLLMFG